MTTIYFVPTTKSVVIVIERPVRDYTAPRQSAVKGAVQDVNQKVSIVYGFYSSEGKSQFGEVAGYRRKVTYMEAQLGRSVCSLLISTGEGDIAVDTSGKMVKAPSILLTSEYFRAIPFATFAHIGGSDEEVSIEDVAMAACRRGIAVMRAISMFDNRADDEALHIKLYVDVAEFAKRHCPPAHLTMGDSAEMIAKVCAIMEKLADNRPDRDLYQLVLGGFADEPVSSERLRQTELILAILGN
jgi:hypothetical protein